MSKPFLFEEFKMEETAEVLRELYPFRNVNPSYYTLYHYGLIVGIISRDEFQKAMNYFYTDWQN